MKTKKLHVYSRIFMRESCAREFLENVRWPNGLECIYCFSKEDVYRLHGECKLFHCRKCRKKFSVTKGTVMESSHIPIRKWLLLTFLLCSDKKGISADFISRTMGFTYKTAWHLMHRIREGAQKDYSIIKALGGEGKVVEGDEIYVGNTGKQAPGARGWGHKEKIFSAVERDGQVYSFHVPRTDSATLLPIMLEYIHPDTRLMTDEAKVYIPIGKHFKEHGTVAHGKYQWKKDDDIYTNTVEGYYSTFRRGLCSIYQRPSPKYLQRYVEEFDFRYNSRKIGDTERMLIALGNMLKRRLPLKVLMDTTPYWQRGPDNNRLNNQI